MAGLNGRVRRLEHARRRADSPLTEADRIRAYEEAKRTGQLEFIRSRRSLVGEEVTLPEFEEYDQVIREKDLLGGWADYAIAQAEANGGSTV